MPVLAAPAALWVILAGGLLFLALVLVRFLFTLVSDVRSLAEQTRSAAASLTAVQEQVRHQSKQASERMTTISEGARRVRRPSRDRGRGRMSSDD